MDTLEEITENIKKKKQLLNSGLKDVLFKL